MKEVFQFSLEKTLITCAVALLFKCQKKIPLISLSYQSHDRRCQSKSTMWPNFLYFFEFGRIFLKNTEKVSKSYGLYV